MKTKHSGKNAQTAEDRKLINDLEQLSQSVDDNFTCRLSKVVTRKYAQVIIYSEDDAYTVKTLKKMKVFSTMSQDIARMRRGDTANRRAQIEETKVQNSHQRTEEQVIEQFKQWTENPEVRRCFILAPMEQMRRLRIIYGIPLTKDDLLLQKIVEADPAFGKFKPAPGQIRVKSNSIPSYLAAVKESEERQAQACAKLMSEDGPDLSDIKPPKITTDKSTAQHFAEMEEYAQLVEARKTAFQHEKLAARQPSLSLASAAVIPSPTEHANCPTASPSPGERAGVRAS